MNQSDKSFVEEIKESVLDNWFVDNPNASEVNEYLERLISIIERQALAIEKCKEQRDSTIKCYLLATNEECFSNVDIQRFDKELDAILATDKGHMDTMRRRGMNPATKYNATVLLTYFFVMIVIPFLYLVYAQINAWIEFGKFCWWR